MPASMYLAEPNPVNGEVFSQMSVLVHGAASALVQGISLGFFSDSFFPFVGFRWRCSLWLTVHKAG